MDRGGVRKHRGEEKAAALAADVEEEVGCGSHWKLEALPAKRNGRRQRFWFVRE